MLMMGIEILAHREREMEGLENYISEGRIDKSCCGKAFNVFRWFIWIIGIVLNVVDPILCIYYGIKHIDIGKTLIWLSAFAVIASIVFALSVSIVTSTITLIVNIVLRVIAYQNRYGYEVFLTSRVFSLVSLCFLGVLAVVEVIDETKNSCK